MKQAKLLFSYRMTSIRVLGFLLLLWTFPLLSHGQEVIATQGGFFEGSSGSISFTIGELITETHADDNLILTQGFQQTYTFGVFVEDLEILLTITAFPLPASDHVNIMVTGEPVEDLQYILLDFSGREVGRGKILDNPERISLHGLTGSMYFLRITENEKHLKTLKIIK